MSLKLVSSDEILASAGGDLEWVIKPLCVRGSSMMVYARQGHGKSSMMMQLAHALIHGGTWLGFEVAATGPVIYLQVDMGEHETTKIVQRAELAGYNMDGKLFFSSPDLEDEAIAFDILRDEDMEDLASLCQQVQPLAVIVDTIHDAYEHQDKYKDVNALARKIHRRFKHAIGKDAVFIFLNHQRKQIGKQPKGAEFEDEDAFMGGQAWEGIVSASVQLKRTGRKTAKLRLAKVRLDDKPFDTLDLEIDKHGFMHAKIGYMQMMTLWPDHLPAAEKAKEVAALKTTADALRRIAEITGEKYDTVRMHEHRHRTVDYPWRKYVT